MLEIVLENGIQGESCELDYIYEFQRKTDRPPEPETNPEVDGSGDHVEPPESNPNPNFQTSNAESLNQLSGRKDYSKRQQDYYPKLPDSKGPIPINFDYSLKMAKKLIKEIKLIYTELGVWAVYRFLSILVTRSMSDLLKNDVENDPHPPVVLTSIIETTMKQIWLQLQIEIRPILVHKKFDVIKELCSDRLIKLLGILNEYGGDKKSKSQEMRFTHKKNTGVDWLKDETIPEEEPPLDDEDDEIDLEGESFIDAFNQKSKVEKAVREETVQQAKRSLTGIVLCKDKTISQILTTVINDFATWIDEKSKHIYAKAVSVDHNNVIDKNGEDVIHSYRQAMTNLLVALPEALLNSKYNKFIKKKPSEIPRCNIVILWNEVEKTDYMNYVKARALFTYTCSGPKKMLILNGPLKSDVIKKQRLIHLVSQGHEQQIEEIKNLMVNYEALIIKQLVRQRLEFEKAGDGEEPVKLVGAVQEKRNKMEQRNVPLNDPTNINRPIQSNMVNYKSNTMLILPQNLRKLLMAKD